MRGQKLNVEQRTFLKDIGLNPNKFLLYSIDAESYTFLVKATGKVFHIRR